ncbi:MAG: tRNA uridine-5-carboxymethylaminomethyl(34) synthesis enzyme MnmG [Algisphaera sp.]
MPKPSSKCDFYDVIVIGGGHAGVEAAWAAANLLRPAGGRVALVTMDPSKTGAMSCNPAIGGLAKGQMVREIDALGGLMGQVADATGIQFRVLNQSKGPAVHGPRCQSDKYAYAAQVQKRLATRDNLEVLAGTVEDFLMDAGRCVGVMFLKGASNIQDSHDATPQRLGAKAVVLTTGTFMRAIMHSGEQKTQGGRIGEGSAVGIGGALQKWGLELGRLKTGTPPRLAAESLDLAGLEVQPGDEHPVPFSDLTSLETFPASPQIACWITHTNAASHDLIRANLDRAPMYNGQIATAGPRYCPSIEDKVVRFADRVSHHVFLEPESLSTNEIYCNGISTSLPLDVQEKIVHALPGCERAVILKPGYAVEYDMVWPHQIDATCAVKTIAGLFLAGQINGTSGYEEAAGQGLIAGVNAVRLARDETPWRLRRDEAYLGVMMDDLVTKTPREPYRMFTSRAEHRLLLRSDNAAIRLTPVGRELGTVDDDHWKQFVAKRDLRTHLATTLRTQRKGEKTLEQWAAQPEVSVNEVADALHGELDPLADLGVLRGVLADRLYAGYIERSQREMAQLAKSETRALPDTLDYTTVTGLRSEAAAALNKFRPTTLGQAGRLAGVNPADLMLISVAIKK